MPKILIVEDSPDNMKLFRTLLTLRGHDVVGLSGGDGMLDTIARERPALVLMDIQLPGINGIVALGQIRQDPEIARTPVIAVTASAMTHDRQKIMAAGFDGYQSKPINVKDFLAAVREMLDRT